MPYVTIDPTRYDAESPITESLMSDIIGNIAFNNTEGGVDGTKGGGTLATTSGSPTVIAIVSGSILLLEYISSNIYVDSSDDTFVARSSTGTLTGSFALIGSGSSSITGSGGYGHGSFR